MNIVDIAAVGDDDGDGDVGGCCCCWVVVSCLHLRHIDAMHARVNIDFLTRDGETGCPLTACTLLY